MVLMHIFYSIFKKNYFLTYTLNIAINQYYHYILSSTYRFINIYILYNINILYKVDIPSIIMIY